MKPIKVLIFSLYFPGPGTRIHSNNVVNIIMDNKIFHMSILSSMEKLRAERLQREAEERRRAKALLDQRSGKGKETVKELNDRERPYNSAYFPQLARKRQRRDQDSWRDEILKS